MVYAGGWTWQAAGYAGWEAFFCVAISIGLITLYRERANEKNRVSGLLSSTSFGIYVFHTPLLVAASVLISTVTMHPLAKALVAALTVWVASLAVAWIVRRVPAVGKLFAAAGASSAADLLFSHQPRLPPPIVSDMGDLSFVPLTFPC